MSFNVLTDISSIVLYSLYIKMRNSHFKLGIVDHKTIIIIYNYEITNNKLYYLLKYTI